MPSEKEIEEIIERIKSGKMMSMDDEDSLIDAYLFMKSERDKYKDIVEADTKAMLALDKAYGPDNDSQIEKYEAWDKLFDALALREKKS